MCNSFGIFLTTSGTSRYILLVPAAAAAASAAATTRTAAASRGRKRPHPPPRESLAAKIISTRMRKASSGGVGFYTREIICPGEFQVVCCLVRETEIGKLFFDFVLFYILSPLLLEYLIERELNFVTEFIFSGGKPCVGDQKVKYTLFQLDL